RPLVDRPEHLGGTCQIRQRQVEEQVLSRSCRWRLPGDVVVVVSAVLNGVVEDRRIGRQPGDREIVDVALQGSAVQQHTGDIVEPQALAQIVKRLGCYHCAAFRLDGSGAASCSLPRSRSSKSPMLSIVTSAGGKALIAFASWA